VSARNALDVHRWRLARCGNHPLVPRAVSRARFADGGRIPVRCSAPHVSGSGHGHVRMEASPSPVYGAALLMRLGFTPFRGSNPRASAS
jgi:hypothetical protein